MGVKKGYDSPIVEDEDFMDESEEEIMEDEEEFEEEKPKGIPFKRFQQVVQKNRALEEQFNSALKRLERLETPPSMEKDELDDLEDENAKTLFKKRFDKVEKKYANRIEALERQLKRQEAALLNPEIRENSSAIEKMRRHYIEKTGVELPDEVLLDLVRRSKPKKKVEVEEDVEEFPASMHNAQRRVPTGTGGSPHMKTETRKKKDPLADFKF